MGSYKEAILDILDRLTCPHCSEIFTRPVTLDCGHSVCWACAVKICSKNKEGQRCCCPKCGVELVTKYIYSMINWTLREAAAIVHVVTASLWKGRSAPEVSSAGGSESGLYSLGTSCSIGSMEPPPFMASTRELFIRMFLPTDGPESEDGLSQRPSGFSDCSEREQRYEDGTSTRGSLPSSGGLCDPELPQQSAPASVRAQIMDLLTRMFSDGTGGSVYKTSPYKQVLSHILEPFACPHCKEIVGVPVTLDCGHTLCLSCAENISSENEQGQQYCCCPKCGAESVTENVHSKVNWTLNKAVNAVREQAVVLWMELRTLEARSAGDSDVGNISSECAFWSIASMFSPPDMAGKRELFDRMFLLTDGLESEDGLSQRPSGSSDCSERQHPSEYGTSVRRLLSGYGKYLLGWLFKSKLAEQSAPGSTVADSMDSLTHTTSDGTQTGRYKQASLDILDRLTCSHCQEIFTYPVRLDCGHTVCLACAREIGSKNKEGQRCCCCCTNCEEESVREYLLSRVTRTLLSVAVVVLGVTALIWNGQCVPKACSAGTSGVGDIRSECAVRSSWSIGSMSQPFYMQSKLDLSNRIFLLPDGLKVKVNSHGGPPDSRTVVRANSDLRMRLPLGTYLFRRLFEPELPEQSAVTSSHSMSSSQTRCVMGRQDSNPFCMKVLSPTNSIPDRPAPDGKLREPEISSPHGIVLHPCGTSLERVWSSSGL